MFVGEFTNWLYTSKNRVFAFGEGYGNIPIEVSETLGVSENNRLIQIDSGYTHFIMLLEDGVYTWGSNRWVNSVMEIIMIVKLRLI